MLRLSARLLRLQRRHLLRGFSRLLCCVHLFEKLRAVLYVMYVMYKTVLAWCEGAEWGTGRDWVSCLIPKLTLPWRGSDVAYLRRVDHAEAATRRVLSPSGNSLPALRACLRHSYR